MTEEEFKRRAWQHILGLVRLLCLYWFNKSLLGQDEVRVWSNKHLLGQDEVRVK